VASQTPGVFLRTGAANFGGRANEADIQRSEVERGDSAEFCEEDSLMRMKLIGLLVVGCLALTVTFAAGSPAMPAAKAVTGEEGPAAAATATPAEPHPEIRQAIAALRRAKAHMEHAAHDFGGHRVDAIKATDEAIHQLEDCLKYDKD